MDDALRQFRAAFPESACLDTIMALRFGGTAFDCPACGRNGGFVRDVKHRAFACRACGHALYPCVGTPFEPLRIALSDWFFAVKLGSGRNGGPSARALQRRLGCPAGTARYMHDALKRLAAADAAGPLVGWYVAIAKRVGDGGAAAASPTADPSALATQEAVAPVRARLRGHHLVAAASGLIVVAAIGTAVLALRQESATVPSDSAPALVAAPTPPSILLSAVEDDLAAAQQAVDFIEKEEPTIVPQERADPIVTSPGNANQILTFGPIKIRRHLVETIVRAARVVGADPSLLMAVADKESSFATEVKAKTSSATGLYQFIESTWLGAVKDFGAKHGLAGEAALIQRVDRRHVVADPGERARILDLRREPYLSALLAAEMLKRDTLRIERRIGRPLTGGEVYLVHFLGPGGAELFIDAMEGAPDRVAAELLPKPAEANRPIFYDKAGGTLSLAEVHKKFEAMISVRLARYREVKRIQAAVEPAPGKRVD